MEAVGPEVDHEPPADADRVGKGIDLGDGGDPTLGHSFLARTLDPARIAADQVVINGRLHDAFE